MSYGKNKKYRTDIPDWMMKIFIKSLNARYIIIPEERLINNINVNSKNMIGFPLWEKGGNSFILQVGSFRQVKDDEIIGIYKKDFRKLAKYLNLIDIKMLVEIYFSLSMLAIDFSITSKKIIFESEPFQYKHLYPYFKLNEEKILLIEKRRFLNYKFK